MKRSAHSMLRRAVLVGAVLLVLSAAAADAADYAVIKVMHRPAGELVDAVKAMLSADGTVIADETNNALIVMDDPAVLAKVKDLVAALDVPARHVRLRVTFFEAGDRHAVDLSVRWRYRNGGFVIGDYLGGGEGLRIGAVGGAVKMSGTSVTNQELLILSGQQGRFVTGTNVPVKDEVIVRLRRDRVIGQGVVFREVTTGFIFTPTILGTKVHLDIIPFLSYFMDTEEGSIVFYDAATTVSIDDGMTVVIAENETETGKIVGDIFSGFSGSGRTGTFYIAVTPHIED
jgi:type II secretory pathway component GspD/PulD (secretin)